jgi:hypothetical protein
MPSSDIVRGGSSLPQKVAEQFRTGRVGEDRRQSRGRCLDDAAGVSNLTQEDTDHGKR